MPNVKPVSEMSTEEKIDAIYTLLNGHPMDPEGGGLIKAHREHANRLAKLERAKEYAFAWIAGGLAVSSAIWAVVIVYLNHKPR